MNTINEKQGTGVLTTIQNIPVKTTKKRSLSRKQQTTQIMPQQKCRTKVSEAHQYTASSQNEQNKYKTFQNNNRKTAIKLKLLNSKKRSVKKCQLGIGYETSSNLIPKTKVYKQFFPQRTLTMFKKLAFKNWNAKQESQKMKYSPKTDKCPSLFRNYGQRTTLDIKNSEIHLKIVSIGQSFHFKLDEQQSKKCSKHQNKKYSLEKKVCFSQLQNKNEANKIWDGFGPWSFQEAEL